MVIGHGAAGTVESIGRGVTRLAPGDDVNLALDRLADGQALRQVIEF